MDIICPRCGEPCDMDELHYADVNGARLTFSEARRIFFDQRQGCGVIFSGRPCPKTRTLATMASAAFYEIMGDDVDGIASALDDMRGYVPETGDI